VYDQPYALHQPRPTGVLLVVVVVCSERVTKPTTVLLEANDLAETNSLLLLRSLKPEEEQNDGLLVNDPPPLGLPQRIAHSRFPSARPFRQRLLVPSENARFQERLDQNLQTLHDVHESAIRRSLWTALSKARFRSTTTNM
jgi:hypothetical protein